MKRYPEEVMAVLVHKSVTRTLFTMAFPMLAGTFAMNAYSLTDTWFVSRLGTLPLAAMGFAFPVIMVLTFAAGGLGTGVTTLASHALGRHDSEDAARLVTHGIALTVALSVVMAVGGYLGMNAIFRQLGADETLLPLIRQYMGIWFLGALTMSLPMMLMPLSAAVITWILSRFGHEAVAAGGAAQRIEMFAFVIPMALGMSLTPFVSQNFGAARTDRIREAMSVSTRFALCYGGLVAVVFFLAAPWLAAVFTQDPKVSGILVAYIRIISFGYGMMEVHRYCGFFLTGLHRPASTTLLNALRVLVFLIPLSWLGAHWFGVRGVFLGRLATDLSVGSIGLLWVRRVTEAAAASTRKPRSSDTV